jgi:hypothetical protein
MSEQVTPRASSSLATRHHHSDQTSDVSTHAIVACVPSAPQAVLATRDQFASTPGYVWPAALRVSRTKGTRGVWEMTWSFASPDGGATFEFARRDGELICLWRRIGDHGVFKDP